CREVPGRAGCARRSSVVGGASAAVEAGGAGAGWVAAGCRGWLAGAVLLRLRGVGPGPGGRRGGRAGDRAGARAPAGGDHPEPAASPRAAAAVSLSCGGVEFPLVALPAEEFPARPEPPAAAGSADGGVLAAAIAQVVPAASRDDTLPMLTGVCLDFDGTALTMAATDRYRLAVRELPWQPASDGLRAAALVPARTLAEAARTMAVGIPVTV